VLTYTRLEDTYFEPRRDTDVLYSPQPIEEYEEAIIFLISIATQSKWYVFSGPNSTPGTDDCVSVCCHLLLDAPQWITAQ
jgi:hypothetical protein